MPYKEYCKALGIVRLRLPMRVFSKRETSDDPFLSLLRSIEDSGRDRSDLGGYLNIPSDEIVCGD